MSDSTRFDIQVFISYTKKLCPLILFDEVLDLYEVFKETAKSTSREEIEAFLAPKMIRFGGGEKSVWL